MGGLAEMSAEPSLLSLILATAPTAAATAVAMAVSSDISLGAYGWASMFALFGIVTRHASVAAQEGRFDLKKLAFDLPTAPMLGVGALVGATYYQVEPYVIPFLAMVSGLLGPSWIREAWTAIRDTLLSRLGKGKGDPPK